MRLLHTLFFENIVFSLILLCGGNSDNKPNIETHITFANQGPGDRERGQQPCNHAVPGGRAFEPPAEAAGRVFCAPEPPRSRRAAGTIALAPEPPHARRTNGRADRDAEPPRGGKVLPTVLEFSCPQPAKTRSLP